MKRHWIITCAIASATIALAENANTTPGAMTRDGMTLQSGARVNLPEDPDTVRDNNEDVRLNRDRAPAALQPGDAQRDSAARARGARTRDQDVGASAIRTDQTNQVRTDGLDVTNLDAQPAGATIAGQANAQAGASPIVGTTPATTRAASVAAPIQTSPGVGVVTTPGASSSAQTGVITAPAAAQTPVITAPTSPQATSPGVGVITAPSGALETSADTAPGPRVESSSDPDAIRAGATLTPPPGPSVRASDGDSSRAGASSAGPSAIDVNKRTLDLSQDTLAQPAAGQVSPAPATQPGATTQPAAAFPAPPPPSPAPMR